MGRVVKNSGLDLVKKTGQKLNQQQSMKPSKKFQTLLFTMVLTASILLAALSCASATPPTVTDFSLNYVDNSYDVAPQPTSTKNPYTGEVTTSTIPGYHVENKSIVATIENPSGASYYNFRWKGHHADEDSWKYYPFNPNVGGEFFLGDWYSVPNQASTTSETVLYLTFIHDEIPPNGELDIQIQVLYGGFRAVPYGHAMPLPGGPTYDFYFEGEASGWSHTEVFTMPYSTSTHAPTVEPTPSPSVPEFPTAALLPLMITVSLAVFLFIRKNNHHGKKCLITLNQTLI